MCALCAFHGSQKGEHPSMAMVCLWRGLSSCCDRPRQMVPFPVMSQTLQNTLAVTLQLLPGFTGRTVASYGRSRLNFRGVCMRPEGPIGFARYIPRDPCVISVRTHEIPCKMGTSTVSKRPQTPPRCTRRKRWGTYGVAAWSNVRLQPLHCRTPPQDSSRLPVEVLRTVLKSEGDR